MKRRSALKNIMIGYGSLISLPFWMEACGISDKDSHQSSFSPFEQEMLAKIADAMIPAGNAIGALSVGVDKYLQKILDDCYEKPVQENVKKQLISLETSAKSRFGKSFGACNIQQIQVMMLNLSGSKVKEESVFFDLMKTETIRGFNTSQKVMQDYLGYQVAPGHYYGCVEIKY